jgi:endonuclease/exonuclease/phosphatase family metal-dependent hydrolase
MSTNFFRVATYNILDPATAVHCANIDRRKGNPGVRFNREKKSYESNWETRKCNIAENIRNSEAGIVCLQEVTSAALKSISSLLLNIYKEAIHGPHESTFLTNGILEQRHGVAILYKPREFKLLEARVFGEHRKFAIAKFQHMTSGKVFHVASLHLSCVFKDSPQQKRKIMEILDKVSHWKDCILCGDFNNFLEKNSPIVSLFRENFFEHCGNPPSQVNQHEAIDGIFCKFEKNGQERIILETNLGTQKGTENNRLLRASDHSLLWTRIDIGISQNSKLQRAVISQDGVSSDSWDLDVHLTGGGGGGGGGGNSSCSHDFETPFGYVEETSLTSQKKSSRSNSSVSLVNSSRSDSPESQEGSRDSSSSISLVNSSRSDSPESQEGSMDSSSSVSLVNSSRSDSPESQEGSMDSSSSVSLLDSSRSDSPDSGGRSNRSSSLSSDSDQNSTEQNGLEREKTWEDYANEDF